MVYTFINTWSSDWFLFDGDDFKERIENTGHKVTAFYKLLPKNTRKQMSLAAFREYISSNYMPIKLFDECETALNQLERIQLCIK